MYLQIKVIPRSAKTEFVERMQDDTLKIRVKAVPEKGRANHELLRFLAQVLIVDKKDLAIVSGQTDARKLIKVPDSIKLPW